MEKFVRLSKGMWLEFLEEIQNKMKNADVSDKDMADELKAEYPDYAYYLINSAVKTSRQFLQLSDRVQQLLADDINFFGLETKKIIKKASEITGNDYSLIAAVVYGLAAKIQEITATQAKMLADKYIARDLLFESTHLLVQCIISSEFKCYTRKTTGIALQILETAIREKQNYLQKELQAKREKERLEREQKKRNQEEERRQKEEKRADRIKEILARSRVPIRFAHGAVSSAVPLNNEGEIALMKNGTKIILQEEVYEIEKSPSGQVKKNVIIGARVIEPENTKNAQVAATGTAFDAIKETKALCLTNNMMWVVFQRKLVKLSVAPEDIKGNATSLGVKSGTLIVKASNLRVFEVDERGLAYAGKAKRPAKKPSEKERRIALSAG